ncbi:MAG: Metal-dependent phosphohydrolase, HD subdomain [uncultured Gemmatimonadetes bacterium]|uniref:Metal-dependent phosphohydrolase, HD subdomain n=1 Tax=uncultured Gemmatimonadota bacterium TaxID=203437 RepID=A0A6J4MJN2_9BACT|nr:MAG: Metal-dependent phosphohydrolase, HD subdomain [uncultured Gemmatimonadota bacterium]
MSTQATGGLPFGGAASSADDRGLQRRGRDLLFALASAIRALQLYPLENQAVVHALDELHAAAHAVLEQESDLSVRYVGDVFFVNDLRLRVDLASYATFGYVGRALQRHGVGQVEVFPGVESGEWTAFLSLLSTEPDEEDRFGPFQERLGRSAVLRIAVHPDREREDEPPDDARQMAKRAYAQTVAVARETMSALRMGRGVSLRPVKRAVQSIVDQVLTNESSIFGLTTLRDYDEYTFTHSVNVCIFSVALGKKLGFDKHQLYELGLGALLHDVGKVKMPWELINKNGPLTTEEFRVMQEHPAEGLLSLFALRGLAELPLRAMLIAYEHHMKVDQTGYPRSIRPRATTLFGRIVAVADGFDAATTKRSYQAQPWPADQVLREMRDNPTRGFDPLIVKAFISMTGIYPVGSLVILDSYELAVVVAASTRADAMHQPTVRIIHNAMGIPLDPAPVVDLTQTDPATGRPLRAIIKTTDPERYGIHVGDYFV